jgi:hypothetical protein
MWRVFFTTWCCFVTGATSFALMSMIAPCPVFVTEIDTLVLVAAPALSVTVTVTV